MNTLVSLVWKILARHWALLIGLVGLAGGIGYIISRTSTGPVDFPWWSIIMVVIWAVIEILGRLHEILYGGHLIGIIGLGLLTVIYFSSSEFTDLATTRFQFHSLLTGVATWAVLDIRAYMQYLSMRRQKD